ncbi:MAG TPA: hypothetical protein RMH99_10405 [Sandaracinaceae bacterium LLY-WYZ-13_1]|nr:hypothetical protein [Sandaracinaceae bacterium LLY-WYZ-13_1]
MTRPEYAGPVRARFRREAGALHWDRLSAEQRRVARQAIALIGRAGERSGAADELDERCLRLARRRRNQTILIDGGRGSGKTTVMLTLLEQLALAEATLASRRRPEDPALADEVNLMLAEVHPVPLRIVDLSAIPPGRDLMLTLASNLHQAADERGLVGDDMPPWRREGDGPNLAASWKALVRTIAEGRSSSVDRRLHGADATTRADELRSTERAAYDLERVFREYVTDFRKAYARYRGVRRGHRVVLCLPIDDADMTSSRMAELTVLLRQLNHPSLCFLVTGHTDLFLRVLREHVLAELIEPASSLASSVAGGDPESARRRAKQLTVDLYDKVVPPQQRCRVSPLRLDERLKHELGTDSEGRALCLRRSLEAFFAPVWWAELHPPIARPSAASYFERWQRLAMALPPYLRGLIDLEQTLTGLRERHPEEDVRALSETARTIWRSAVRREALPVRHEEALLQAVRTLDGAGALRVRGGSLELAWVHVVLERRELVPGWRVLSMVPDYLRGAVDEDEEYGAEREVSERLAAAFAFAQDVALDQERGELVRTGPSVHAMPGYRELSWSPPPFEDMDVDLVRFRWPFPVELGFAAAFDFGQRWKEILEETSEQPNEESRARDLVIAYLREVCAAVEPFALRDAALSSLAERVASMLRLDAENDRDAVLRRFADRHLGLLAAPEAGLPSVVANEILDAYLNARGAGVGPSRARERLARERRNWMRAAVARGGGQAHDAELDELCRRIDETPEFASHAWARRVEGRPSSSLPPAGQALLDLLSRIQAEHPSDAVTTRPQRLAEYLDLPSRRPLLYELSRSLVETLTERVGYLGRVRRVGRQVAWHVLQCTLEQQRDGVPALVAELERRTSEQPEGLVPLRRRALSPSVVHASRPHHVELESSVAGVRFIASARLPGFEHVVDLPGGEVRALPTSVDAAYRLWWDVYSDATGRDLREGAPEPPDGVGYWSGAGTVPESSPFDFIPWPAPNWPAFYDRELSETAWHEEVYELLLAASRENAAHRGGWVDAAVFWLFQFVPEMWVSRTSSAAFTFGPSEREWIEAIGLIEELARNPGAADARTKAFVAWAESLALFAAPEYGLSLPVAELLLARARDLGALAECRRRWLFGALSRSARRNDGSPPPDRLELQVKLWLEQHAKQNASHPWYRMLAGRPRVVKSGRRPPPNPARTKVEQSASKKSATRKAASKKTASKKTAQKPKRKKRRGGDSAGDEET